MTTNGHSPEITALVETQAYDIETLTERLAELELALEDSGWQRLGDEGREFSADARRRIVDLSRMMYLKNPLIKRGVNVQVQYVWGQGCTMRAVDEQIDAVIQTFLDDEQNQAELTAHQAREQKERELQTDGDLFFVLFPNPITGAVRVRTVYPGEITDILTNPDDKKDPWYYKREWTETALDGTTQPRTAYYPDWRYTPRARPALIGGKEVRWQSPIYHVKVGGFSDWKFGCPEVYAALDWARAYKEFLEDWATFTRALSRYAHKLVTKGGARGVAAAKARLSTTLGTSANAYPETNPPATTGATWIGAEGNTIEPFRIGGANVSMEDGRRMLLMVAAAMGLPETFFGDVSVGTLATATSLDRPTELQMRSRQTLWEGIHQRLFEYVTLWAVKASQGPLRGLGTVKKVRDGEEIVESVAWGASIDATTEIKFPPIVAPNRKEDVDAVTELATAQPVTMDRRSFLKMGLEALGVANIEDVLDEIEKAFVIEQAQQAAADEIARQHALELAQAQQPQPPAPIKKTVQRDEQGKIASVTEAAA